MAKKVSKPRFFKKLRVTRRRIIFVAIALVLLGGFFFLRARNKKEVATFRVEKGTVREELVLSGTVKAEKHANLTFPTSGKIAWVGVAEGQKVHRGQSLTSLDKTVLNTTYQQALNTYKDKQATAEKIEDDVKDHAGDETFTQKATRTSAQVARDSAYDAVLAAEYNLKNATLVAPFTGIIASLNFSNAGVNVSAQEAIVEIVDPASIYFEVEADQTDIAKIKKDQEVMIVLDSFSDKQLKGKVNFVGITPKVGEAGAIYKVKVSFENLSDEILARVGMTGDARFSLSQKENALFVPAQFVNSERGGRFVNLGKMGNKVPVEVGIENDTQTEIKNGVKEGDLLYD